MTSILDALTRIDPATGLVSYVEDIKPYHTKILDVQIEYVYTDLAVGTASDKFHTLVTQFSLKPDVTYNCGYGITWDNRDVTNETYAITQATPPTVGDEASNSFVFEKPATSSHGFFVTSLKAATMRMTNMYTVTASNPSARTLTVTGNITSLVSSGDQIGLNAELTTGGVRNIVHTVTAVAVSGPNTIITVAENVPSQLVHPSTLHVFTDSDNIPLWAFKATKVTVQSSDTLPMRLDSQAEYYLVPGSVQGEFTLATKRYPQNWFDYIHLETEGLGQLTVSRVEVLLPGERIDVRGSTLNRNDGRYTVKYTIQDATTITVYVYEPIVLATPDGNLTDGAVYLTDEGYDDTYLCDLATAPDLYAQGRTSERLQFEYSIVFRAVAEGDAIENPGSGGYSTAGFSGVVMYDDGAPNFAATTINAAGDMIIGPAGYDTNFFDVGPMDSVVVNPYPGV